MMVIDTVSTEIGDLEHMYTVYTRDYSCMDGWSSHCHWYDPGIVGYMFLQLGNVDEYNL